MKKMNLLTHIAIGDAYGAGYEFVDHEPLTQLEGFKAHPRHKIIPGAYTDDTQMSIAIAEHIVENRPRTPLAFAKSFLTSFKRDQRLGYASRFQVFLENVPDADTFVKTIKPTSDKCGAAMRSVPIGILPLKEVVTFARMQAAVTHSGPAVDASVIIALASHFLLTGHPVSSLPTVLKQFFPNYPDLFNWTGYVDGKAIPTISAALTALYTSNSYTECLLKSINFTGDVDSVGAIALGLCACTNMPNDLPKHLYYQLEKGTYGRKFLSELDGKLAAYLKNSQPLGNLLTQPLP